MFLTVGSPTLAAYSLALTVVNSRWAFRKFTTIKYPNRKNAALILTSLQQIPLKVTSEDGLLASLIVLPENDQWWDEMVDRLDYNYTWSIATATSIAWVAIAFVFTVIDSFMSLGENLNSNGQGVGSLWLWLLPLVVGWLLIPVSGRTKLVGALYRANENVFVATPDVNQDTAILEDGKCTHEPISVRSMTDDRAIGMLERREAVYRDEGKSAPIFNYARFWGWVDVVEEVVEAFEHASDNVKKHKTVSHERWVLADKWAEVNAANRTGSLRQIQAYCGDYTLRLHQRRKRWGEGAVKRVTVASIFALGLQWGTTVSSVLVVLYTPTTGLGCRSGSYILYGVLSTLIWAMLLTSSVLSHYCSIHTPKDHTVYVRPARLSSIALAAWISVFLRRVAVIIAALNSIWIVAVCVFQFANVFDTCYCNSSVLGRGSANAYNVITTAFAMEQMKGVWIGSIVLASGVVVLFILFVSLMVEPPTEDKR